MKKILFRKIVKIIFYFMRIFHIKRNKIVFSNFSGKGYGDNPKYIAENLLDEELDLVWLVCDHDDKSIPNEIRKVKIKSLRGIYELVTAKIWIDNCRKPSYVVKRRNQFYIQTWHGSFPLKKIEMDAEQSLSKEYVKSAKNDSNMIDLMISNNKFTTKIYKEKFWYKGNVLECGLPRNIVFFNDKVDIKKNIFMKYNIKSDKKVVIYAPTFRKDNNLKYYDLNYNECIKKINYKFNSNYIMFVRLHPGMKNKININCDNVIDVSDYSDMQELLSISDILITDYSSTMFDFIIKEKPIFIYANDIENYISERGMYFDIFKLPFDISQNNIELLDNIENFDILNFKEKLENFKNNIEFNESYNDINKIISIIKKEVRS